MAKANERKNFDRRENTSEGHDVKWELCVGDLLHLQAWPFQKNYRTHCEKTPTSWHFKMSLPEVREDGTCSLVVLLERTDSANLDLEACLWIDICDPNDNLIFPKQTFSKVGMMPGDEIRETVEITPLPNMRRAIRQRVVVFVTLMICFCHSDSDS